MRIAIAGPPKAGKSTLANTLEGPVRHTDDALHLGWSAASNEISRWFDEPGPWVIEGVAVLRALRKWRERNPSSPPPLDRFVWLTSIHEQYSKRGQYSMAKQLESEYSQLQWWLDPYLSDVGQVSKHAPVAASDTGGFPPISQTPNGARSAGRCPPVPISRAKTTKSQSVNEKPASKPPRERGARKFSLAAPPAPAPDPEPRAGELAPIVTTSFLLAFEQLGGVKGLVRWGRRNPSAFYRTLAALGPALGRHAKGHGLVVQVAQFGDKQPGRVIDAATQAAADDPDPA